MKKYILSFIVLCSAPFTLTFAATPQFTVSGSGDGNNVLVTITSADGNSPVALYFKSNTDGTTRSQVIGTTNGLGAFSGTISTNGVGINADTPVYTMINGYTSNSLTWPYQTTNTQTQIAFSQTNPYVAIGQSGTLTISGGSGNYYISSNSNSGLVSASLSGNTLSYTGVGNGSSIITICGASGGLCSSTTISTNTSINGGLTITPSSLTLAPTQSGTFTVSGGNAPYTVTTVSGDNLMYFANNNSISISGSTNGARLLNVCSSNNVCSQITVTITGVANNVVTLSPSTITLTPNQNGTVQLSGGNGSYTVSTISGDSVSALISGNMLTVSGQNSGTRTLSICSSNATCSTLQVNIGGVGQTSNIQYSLFLAVNERMRLNLSGGNGSPFYIQSGVSSPVTASINNTVLSVTGKSFGSSSVTVCQGGNSNGNCLPFTFVVNQADTSNNGTGGPYTFSVDLWYGQTSSEVTELQKYLIGENYLVSDATGYFGSLTLDAVKRFQAAKSISTTGYVGVLTRGTLNNN
jgi:hypothetical protein